jgi:hypothetical protein
MSTYFNGAQFRAIDADAAADSEPMSAALEAQIANNHEYLHRIGGGAVVKLGAPAGSNIGDDNAIEASAVGIASLDQQPVLVTRGLSEIRVDWHGRLEFYPLDVRLELVGFGVVDGTWGVGGTDNVTRTLTLTLPAPAEYEFETRLILYQLGQAGAPDGLGNLGLLNVGQAEAPAGSGLITTTFDRCLLIGSDDTPYEPLARDPAATLSDGTTGELALTTSAASGSALRIREAELHRIATRSVQITQRHA